MPKRRIPAPIGARFHRLVVLGEAPDMFSGQDQRAVRRWTFQCDCGQQKVVIADHAKTGKVHSCGCLRVELALLNRLLTKRQKDAVRAGMITEEGLTKETMNGSSPY